MTADFIKYIPDTTIEEIDDESSSDEMDLEYAAKEYGEVIMLADAFTTTMDDNDAVNNEIIMKDSLATVSEKKAPSIKYKKYGEDQVKRFFELMMKEGYTVPKAAEIAGIPRSTAYELKKESKKNPDKLKGNTKLEDKHTFFLIELIDRNPSITVMEAKEDLFSKFSGLSITASGVNKHMKKATGVKYMANCIFMDESGFNAHQIRKHAWSCIVEPLKSSDAALIQKEFPQPEKKKEKKKKEAINKRDYKPLFLPPYSPFLNPIEECWAKVKTNIRKNQLCKVDQLTPRIAAACATVTAEDCQGWIRHSKTFWDRYLSKELLLC
ncbi:hypothetical protein G6F37_002396 [Rhizopus arrhizus]|nr:hypothetical protein G6F38_000831 [Rhizopus arrhizus]KAG1162170.1 hypothetical protein G6F37_002396 [Rhizopus arrhizus]